MKKMIIAIAMVLMLNCPVFGFNVLDFLFSSPFFVKQKRTVSRIYLHATLADLLDFRTFEASGLTVEALEPVYNDDKLVKVTIVLRDPGTSKRIIYECKNKDKIHKIVECKEIIIN